MRVLIIEDEMVIARDLQRIVRKLEVSQCQVVNTPEAAIELVPNMLPHLILCDINLEHQTYDGIQLMRQLQKTVVTQLIFITAHSNPSVLDKATELNPLNYILKPFEESQVLSTLHVALKKNSVQNSGIVKDNWTSILTDTELRIVRLIAKGNTTKAISERLSSSPKTVENHRYNIAKKLKLEIANNSLLSWAIAHQKELS